MAGNEPDAQLADRSEARGTERDGAARLVSGMIVNDRFRISGFLGRGGMGEVYRADDLLLELPVALKFLPDSFRDDRVRLKRFYAEVRLARRITHPAVCRTHDVQHHEGRPFLSMELVDGEDLKTLLRRIGRPPTDRALAISRQLCGGLAAAHAQGILHRDLKPENVMIDGQGNVRIMDFGLAAAETVSADDLRWTARSPWLQALATVGETTEEVYGTPAYMAPEQLAGQEATPASDIYALGLVLYELFTGASAFTSTSYQDRVRQQTELGVARPSSRIADLDPSVEEVILQCLATDPADRPSSALAVAAALPGGDPLAATLAAGETPSPEVVAAAGGVGGLRPRTAIAGVVAIAAGIALVALVGDWRQPFFHELDRPPEVLTHEARRILEDLGPEVPPADHARGFTLEGEPGGPRRLVFWYRQSPRTLAEGRRLEYRALTFTNPALAVPGMAGVRLDVHGVLVEYVRVPAPEESPATAALDWAGLFERAGLDPRNARESPPTGVPPVFGDERHAWDVDVTGAALRVEAASFRGRPVWFEVMADYHVPERRKTGPGVYAPLFLWFLGLVVAYRNLRMGRGDREGAARFAGFVALSTLFGRALSNPRMLEPPLVWFFLLSVLFWTFTYGVLYLALEPIVRRRWPDTLVSWTRLLRGRPLDPLVGRDVLIGVLGGVVLTLFEQGLSLDAYAGWPTSPALLAGGWSVFGSLIHHCLKAVQLCLAALMLLALLRQVVGRPWVAFVVGVPVLYILLGELSRPWGWRGWGVELLSICYMGLSLGLLIRPGLLACFVALTVNNFLGSALMTTHLGAWYADSAVAGILATLAFAAWAFYAALQARPSSAPGRLAG